MTVKEVLQLTLLFFAVYFSVQFLNEETKKQEHKTVLSKLFSNDKRYVINEIKKEFDYVKVTDSNIEFCDNDGKPVLKINFNEIVKILEEPQLTIVTIGQRGKTIFTIHEINLKEDKGEIIDINEWFKDNPIDPIELENFVENLTTDPTKWDFIDKDKEDHSSKSPEKWDDFITSENLPTMTWWNSLTSTSTNDFENSLASLNKQIIPVRGDGNCFFYSISEGLKERGLITHTSSCEIMHVYFCGNTQSILKI